jgi:amino acid transporter
MSLYSLIMGRRLASSEQDDVKIGVFSGLPAMGLDALSSSAYGPEAALTILIPLGVAGLNQIVPITLVIIALLLMLFASYWQTTAAYTVNGGSYTVAKENLGPWFGLLAAAALMVDYILNVAVGISAGIAALTSAAPHLHHYTLPMCLGVLAFVTLINLRGTGEAGIAFSVPTYVFLVSLAIIVSVGMVRMISTGGHPHPVVDPPAVPKTVEAVSLWLLLRAFASGCTAMTGVEAVSNGVSAFKEPRVTNAHRTLACIVAILAVLLGGIAWLAHGYHIGAMDQTKHGYQSVLSQLTAAVVGRGWFYKVAIGSILAVLCLSANTSFVDFPRLCRLIAKDDFLPRSFAAVGRRLVYSVGVLALAVAAGALLCLFGGITDRLIPLYAVGAFLAFTLSQSGMVIHWRRQLKNPDAPLTIQAGNNKPRRSGAHTKLYVNGVGAVATGIALCIILVAKFVEGAWLTVLMVPSLLLLFHLIHRHYKWVDRQMHSDDSLRIEQTSPPVALVPMQRWSKPVAKSLQFGMHLTPEVIAIHLNNLDGDEADGEEERIKKEWMEKVDAPARSLGLKPPELEVARTPYREFVAPLLSQIDKIKTQYPGRRIAVIIPELVEQHWWLALLHSRRAARLRNALRLRKDVRVVVIDVPWFVQREPSQ